MYFSRVKTVYREYTIVRQTDGNVNVSLKFARGIKKKEKYLFDSLSREIASFSLQFLSF